MGKHTQRPHGVARRKQRARSVQDCHASTGVPWSEIPDFAKPDVATDGRDGSAKDSLPPLDELAIPPKLLSLPVLHENRPRGAKAISMLRVRAIGWQAASREHG